MRKVAFFYLEVLNETEQLMLFATDFNKKRYGLELILNIVLPVDIQDEKIRKTIARLESMTRKDAKEST